jgi:hypothetical protein
VFPTGLFHPALTSRFPYRRINRRINRRDSRFASLFWKLGPAKTTRVERLNHTNRTILPCCPCPAAPDLVEYRLVARDRLVRSLGATPQALQSDLFLRDRRKSSTFQLQYLGCVEFVVGSLPAAAACPELQRQFFNTPPPHRDTCVTGVLNQLVAAAGREPGRYRFCN